MTYNILTQARLQTLLTYNSETGNFVRNIPRGNTKQGQIAGRVNHDGYLIFVLDRRRYLAHRLAWLYVYGSFPNQELDHINGVRHDNRIVNLRLATRSEQCQNKKISTKNTSGFVGVSWHSTKLKWTAHIKLNGLKRHLGYFCTKEKAVFARRQAELIYHPYRVN